jgi:hypothetical protein
VKRIQFDELSTSGTVGFTKAKQYLLPSLVGSILLAVAVLAPSTSQASTLITYEGFPYPPLGPFTIDEQGGETNGWAANWGQFLGGATAYVVTNASLANGSLADPSGLLYTYSNCVYSSGGNAGRYFTEPGTWALGGYTNYFSILIKPANTPATGHIEALQIYSNDGNLGTSMGGTVTNFHDMFIGKNSNGLNWGLEYTTNTVVGGTNNTVFVDSYSSVAAASNTTVLLVARVIFAEGAPDSWVLYVNPTPGQPEPAVPAATAIDDIGTEAGLQLDTFNGAQAFFDEIRMGTTFASVTPTTATSPQTDPNLLVWEPFVYNGGVSQGVLDGQPNNGTQASNGWDNVTWDGASLFTGETNFVMVAGSLSDPSGKLLTSGNSVQAVSTNNSFFGAGRYNVYTVLPAKTNANPTYYSFLVQVNNLGSTNIGASGAAYIDIFGQPNNNNLLAGYLFGGNAWGLQSSTNQNLSTVPVVSNQTAFLVVRVNNAGPNNPTPVLLYVNPTPGAPEPASADATNIWTLSAEQNGLTIAVQNGAAATFDEIRVGTNYADVTPVTQVSSNAFVITSMQILNGTNVVVSFLSTSNVVYEVQQNTDLVTGTWTTIASGIPGTGGTIQFTNVVTSATVKRFYRVSHP